MQAVVDHDIGLQQLNRVAAGGLVEVRINTRAHDRFDVCIGTNQRLHHVSDHSCCGHDLRFPASLTTGYCRAIAARSDRQPKQ